MTLAVVAAPLPLRPDPDENSPPVVTLDPSDVLTVVLALGSWSKVSLTRSGEAFSGMGHLGQPDRISSAHCPTVRRAAGRRARDGDRPDRNHHHRRDVEQSQGHQSGRLGLGRLDGGRARARARSALFAGRYGDDLSLGVNERYRSALLEAQTITRIGAASLAALIDAEAAKNKGGADAGVWDPKSTNASSGAAGLTQFIESTWCEMAVWALSFMPCASFCTTGPGVGSGAPHGLMDPGLRQPGREPPRRPMEINALKRS